MSPLDMWPLTRDLFLSGAPRSCLNIESLYICEPLHNKCWSMANRWLTCPALWIWIWVMCWTLATVARSTEGGGGEEKKKKKKKKEQQSWEVRPQETDFISPHRNGKGQSEAGNQMHHVPRPCFTYCTWLESWSGALCSDNIKPGVISPVFC